MCFSVTASFTASLTLLVCGVVTLKRAHEKRLQMIAAIPLLFGAQQCAEGFVWLSFMYPEFASIRLLSAYVFLGFAMVVWPTWIPLAAARLEGPRRHMRYMPSLTAGSLCALAYMIYILLYPISVTLDKHIVYNINPYGHFGSWKAYAAITIAFLYVVATIVPFFITRDRKLRFIGAFTAVSYLVSYFFYAEAFTSVWCFFAAIISLLVYWFVSSR